MKKCILAAGLLAASTVSQAADVGPDASMSSTYDWSGLYVGLQAGYLFGGADHTYSNGAPTGDSSPDGFIGGAHAGYNWQSGAFVFGVEGDIEGSAADGAFANVTGITSSGTSELNWQASVRARVGYAFDRTMVYATGGWAYGDFDFTGGPLGAPFAGGYSEGMSGWTVGAGIEHAFSDNWLARAEYRYTDFGTASGTLAPGFPAVVMPVDVETHALRLGVSYKF